MLKKKLLITFIVILIIFIYFDNVMAITHVEPAKLIVKTEPGQRKTGLIKVTNNGNKKIQLKAILYDWDLNEDDSLKALEAGSNNYTLDGLIKFNPKVFKVNPGKTQVVRFTITAPVDIKKERRGIVFFEEETNLIDEATGARVVTQVGTAIYFVPSTALSKFELHGVKIYNPEVENDMARSLLMVENQGDTTVRYTIHYIVIDKKGALVNKGEDREKVILPGYKRIVAFAIGDKYEPGEYKMKLNIEFYGTEKVGEYVIPFKIK